MQNVYFIISSLYFLITVETLMDVPMHFYQFVYIIILSAACCSLSERYLGGPPHNLQMKSSNFQHILSWQAKSDPALPTYYRVLYTDRRNWKIAKQCSDITQLSCNLTDDFKETFTQYSALVESIIGTEVFNSSLLHFAPLTDTFLGPPEINISSCLNCINVTIKLPTSYYRENGKLLSLIDIYKSLYYVITLKTPDGEHKRPQEETTEEIFNTVIEELYPNRNYCVSVMITASINKHSIPSAWKCVTADSVAEPVADYHTAAVAGAMCVSLMLAGVLKCLHAGGYILQTEALPRALVFIRTLTYSPWTFESEKIASVEIIYKEMKKKANESSGGVSDEDDSDDSESNAINSTCDDSSSQASENPDANPEDFENHEMDVEEDKDTSSELLNPFSKVNSNYSSRQRESPCFTIDLKTVLLGASEENMDSSAALLSSQEDAADWQCARAFEANLDDTENMQKPNCHNDSQEWQNSCHSSDESDSSDSDMEQNTEYIRR
uniref:Coagulation factor III n=1 Tax=Falco tinnunculus TaxID=100819 RepID=A0A8C4U3G5_FALTI